ncbi:MAG: CopG family transcriptional regulator [Actinomycetes bacterium]|jgi:gas vesicle protein
MAMNLRLSEKQSKELRKVAEQRGISMQEAALQAIDEYLSHRAQRLSENIARIKKEDANLLDRLSK